MKSYQLHHLEDKGTMIFQNVGKHSKILLIQHLWDLAGTGLSDILVYQQYLYCLDIVHTLHSFLCICAYLGVN
jgi:hypothetical protein